MLHLLKNLFEPQGYGASHVHEHLDDDGRPFFCDESRCRPEHDRWGQIDHPLTFWHKI